MARVFIVALSAVVLVASCQKPALSGQGERCTRTSDCVDGLKCIELVCIRTLSGEEKKAAEETARAERLAAEQREREEMQNRYCDEAIKAINTAYSYAGISTSGMGDWKSKIREALFTASMPALSSAIFLLTQQLVNADSKEVDLFIKVLSTDDNEFVGIVRKKAVGISACYRLWSATRKDIRAFLHAASQEKYKFNKLSRDSVRFLQGKSSDLTYEVHEGMMKLAEDALMLEMDGGKPSRGQINYGSGSLIGGFREGHGYKGFCVNYVTLLHIVAAKTGIY